MYRCVIITTSLIYITFQFYHECHHFQTVLINCMNQWRHLVHIQMVQITWSKFTLSNIFILSILYCFYQFLSSLLCEYLHFLYLYILSLISFLLFLILVLIYFLHISILLIILLFLKYSFIFTSTILTCFKFYSSVFFKKF